MDADCSRVLHCQLWVTTGRLAVAEHTAAVCNAFKTIIEKRLPLYNNDMKIIILRKTFKVNLNNKILTFVFVRVKGEKAFNIKEWNWYSVLYLTKQWGDSGTCVNQTSHNNRAARDHPSASPATIVPPHPRHPF